MFKAPVVSNKKDTLFYIPSLVEKHFGLEHFNQKVGICLLAQVIFSIAATTKLSVNLLEKHFFKVQKKKANICGYTLEQIISAFEQPISCIDTLDNTQKQIYLTLQTNVHNNVMSTLSDVISGQPVITILDSDVCAIIQNEAISYCDGIVQSTVIRPGKRQMFHCLLALGFDKDDYLVLRDTRHNYAFKGYLKIALGLLNDSFNNVKMLSIDVLNLDIKG